MSEQRVEKQGMRTSTRRSFVLTIVSLAIFLDALDVSIVTIALPRIQEDLHLTTTELQWIPGIYVLTYAGFQLLGGRAADLFGRRRIFLVGATLFGVASFTAGLAQSGWLLILARGGQGVGAALTFPSAVSILTTTFAEGQERNKALGVFGAMGAAGFTAGLILSGVVTTFLNWHWIFFLNVAPILVILLMARLVIPESGSIVWDQSYDLAGAVTITGGLLLLVYAVTQATVPGVTAGKTGGLFAFALVLVTCFILIERRSKAPLMPLSIFWTPTLCAASVASLALQGSVLGFLFIDTLYLQKVLRYSPVNTSLAMAPASVVSGLVALFVAPWVMTRLGLRFSSVLGLLCVACGIALFLRVDGGGDAVGLIPPVVLALSGAGLAGPTLAVAAVREIKLTEQGLAAGLQGTFLQAGGGLGLAITAVVITASLASGHNHTAPSIASQFNGYHMGILVTAASATLGALMALVGIRRQSAHLEPRREHPPL